MTSTSLDLSNRPELEPVSRLAAEVVNAAATLGIPVFMAGAMARDLILAHGYGIATGRRTEDMDLTGQAHIIARPPNNGSQDFLIAAIYNAQ